GIVEAPAGSGVYLHKGTAPTTDGDYVLVWDTGGAGTIYATEPLKVGFDGTAVTVSVGPLYATPEDLPAKLKGNEEVLPDDEAAEILDTACDLIDDRLGARPIDEETGRKVDVTEYEDEPWRLVKLAKATIEVAVNLYNDPGVESRQRMKSVSGDI